MKIQKMLIPLLAVAALLGSAGCAGGGGGGSVPAATTAPPDTAKVDPSNPAIGTVPAPIADRSYSTDVLIFNGAGVSTSDWQSTENIVKSMKLSYKLANSAQLDAMSLDQMASFGLLIVPGGHSPQIINGLKPATRVRVRQAVRDRGVSYVGMCAGAFAAVDSGASTNNPTADAFPVIEGKYLPMWWPNGDTSKTAVVTPVTFANGTQRHLVWWGGPSTPEWKGGVVARYNNGKPAISQASYGKGFIVLTGPHPEAPQGWRATAGNDPDGLDYDVFSSLVKAALTRQPLPTFAN